MIAARSAAKRTYSSGGVGSWTTGRLISRASAGGPGGPTDQLIRRALSAGGRIRQALKSGSAKAGSGPVTGHEPAHAVLNIAVWKGALRPPFEPSACPAASRQRAVGRRRPPTTVVGAAIAIQRVRPLRPRSAASGQLVDRDRAIPQDTSAMPSVRGVLDPPDSGTLRQARLLSGRHRAGDVTRSSRFRGWEGPDPSGGCAGSPGCPRRPPGLGRRFRGSPSRPTASGPRAPGRAPS